MQRDFQMQNAARDNEKTHIIPRYLQLAIRNDEKSHKLLPGVTIAQGGVLPNIQAVLLPKILILNDYNIKLQVTSSILGTRYLGDHHCHEIHAQPFPKLPNNGY
uniref:Uncharacterized protein LOC114333188 n=1 Tax=Diabrotica virgifera virgifera TaxID=50390 RepID=A0A6P7FRE6_DIAVI